VRQVTQVASDGAQVSLITDSSVGVSARIGTSNATGIVQPKVGDPNDLLLQYLPANTQANRGEWVVTSGTVASHNDSLYPPGIPIGQVSSINEESAYKSVNVHPVANLHNLDVVQVLTSASGSLPANLAHLALDPALGTEPGRRPHRGSARLDRGPSMSSPSASLLARIGALSVALVLFQIGVVSEVPLFRGQRRPLAAARRLRGPVLRLDARRGDRLRGRPARGPWPTAADAGRDVADLHADRATGRGACASCATRRPRSRRCSSAPRPRRSR